MSRRSIGLVVSVALGVVAFAQQPPAFKDPRARTSYAMGVEAGQQLKNRAIDLDADAFAKGLKDVLTGKTLQLTDAQVKAAIAELQASVKQREFDLRSARADDSRKAANAFLANNAKAQGVVSLPSGLQYRILVAGQGRAPVDADTVECNYRGTLVNGMEFDASSRGGSSPIIKVDQTIIGLREALKLMSVGSKWQVFIPPALAMGSRTATMVVPPNQALIYDLELVAIK